MSFCTLFILWDFVHRDFLLWDSSWVQQFLKKKIEYYVSLNTEKTYNSSPHTVQFFCRQIAGDGLVLKGLGIKGRSRIAINFARVHRVCWEVMESMAAGNCGL